MAGNCADTGIRRTHVVRLVHMNINMSESLIFFPNAHRNMAGNCADTGIRRTHVVRVTHMNINMSE